ncbi:MAG: hypothetical protein WCD18_26245 [Thermosynechococcaceae cyanobacterium]
MDRVRLKLESPNLILILGTDAAGKNHVANALADRLRPRGQPIEKRAGALSAKPTQALTSEDKGFLALAQERIFLTVFPFLRPLLPLIVAGWLWLDSQRFKQDPYRVTIVISHTALRLLSFALGHRYLGPDDIRLPRYLVQSLRRWRQKTGVQVLVLDVADAIRQQRIQARALAGKADVMDRYMAEDSARSERIEADLVWLARRYLGAYLLENNDLDEVQLNRELDRALAWFQRAS